MRAHGIDISKWDISFDPLKATHPIDFVIQRAGYGVVQDERFDSLHHRDSKGNDITRWRGGFVKKEYCRRMDG